MTMMGVLTTVFVASCLLVAYDTVSWERKENNQISNRKMHVKGPYKILALGGSVTWGVNVEEGQSYPSLLDDMSPDYHVRNLSIRATSSQFPRFCLETMINDDEIYDVILLEFTLNGLDEFEELLQRLRARYPMSIFIYVDLYSLKSEAIDENGVSPKHRGFLPGVDWKWGVHKRKHDDLVTFLKSFTATYSMHMYELPRGNPVINSLDLFSSDWHHLSALGHSVVARGIMRRLESIKDNRANTKTTIVPTLGTWGGGDVCNMWFQSGIIKLPYSRAEMNYFPRFKYALELREPGGSITIYNPKPFPLPLYVGIMSMSDHYPKATFTLGDTVTAVDPKSELPVHMHLNIVKRIGMANPGESMLMIDPIDAMSSMEPFRITAVILCGTCEGADDQKVSKYQ